MIGIFRTRHPTRCQELWAVLDAARIPAVIGLQDGEQVLAVAGVDQERALLELRDYLREDRELVAAAPLPMPAPLGGGFAGILAYSTALALAAGLAAGRTFGADWFAAGRAQAGEIVGGEVWRTVTALTLHIDSRHLVGNVLFGAIFGLLAAQRLGGGVAWLAILLGGALGNGVNALLQNAQHSAVGASTAVFAALGLLVTLALGYKRAGYARADSARAASAQADYVRSASSQAGSSQAGSSQAGFAQTSTSQASFAQASSSQAGFAQASFSQAGSLQAGHAHADSAWAGSARAGEPRSRPARSGVRTLERYSPLVGGVMLLAWTGFGGERTDVLAHVTGFAAGLALGTVLVFVPRTVLERRSVQAVAALASVLILVMAWVVALG